MNRYIQSRRLTQLKLSFLQEKSSFHTIYVSFDTVNQKVQKIKCPPKKSSQRFLLLLDQSKEVSKFVGKILMPLLRDLY